MDSGETLITMGMQGTILGWSLLPGKRQERTADTGECVKRAPAKQERFVSRKERKILQGCYQRWIFKEERSRVRDWDGKEMDMVEIAKANRVRGQPPQATGHGT